MGLRHVEMRVGFGGVLAVSLGGLAGGLAGLVGVLPKLTGQRGVLALLSDSTNSERPGFTATEQKVAAGVRNLFARARNKRIIIATFASNICLLYTSPSPRD